MPVAPGLNSSSKGKTPKRSAASEAMLEVMLESLAVGVFTLIAGVSADAGKLALVFMSGFWLIYLITNASVIQKLESALVVA